MSKAQTDADAKKGLGILLGGVGGLSSFVNELSDAGLRAERGIALDNIGAKDFDPQLRRQYLDRGLWGLINQGAYDRVNELVPSGYSGFEPSDLSGAKGAPGLANDLTRQITVSPSAQPQRLSYEGLTERDLSIDGQKGYIWANPNQPQYGYAAGNYNRGTRQSVNPAVNFLDVELPTDKSTSFKTTGDIVSDNTFNTDRRWGQRDFGPGSRADGDVMFPKESIRGRSEVTAADVFTDAKLRGYDIDPGDFGKDPGKAFKELVETYAEKRGVTPTTALQDLATPVAPLGKNNRFAGSMPAFQQFATGQADPRNLKASGIGSVFAENFEPGIDTNTGYPVRNYLEDVDGNRPFQVNPALDTRFTPSTRTGNFLRRQSGVGLMAGLELALDPGINKALAEGRTGDAILQGGLAIGGGAFTEALTKRGLSELAARGFTAPLRIAASVAPPLTAIQMAAVAERSTPETDWKQELKNDPENSFVQKVRGMEPSKFGQAGPDLPMSLQGPDAKDVMKMPARQRQIRALPIGNQAAANINNEMRFAGTELKRGNIPYLNLPINPLNLFKR